MARTHMASDISIHALREEGDRHRCPDRNTGAGISIHALREEGDRMPERGQFISDISIHALREEGDRQFKRIDGIKMKISIHALREEGDGRISKSRNRPMTFLSTPSVRRATLGKPVIITSGYNFYPRPP